MAEFISLTMRDDVQMLFNVDMIASVQDGKDGTVVYVTDGPYDFIKPKETYEDICRQINRKKAERLAQKALLDELQEIRRRCR